VKQEELNIIEFLSDFNALKKDFGMLKANESLTETPTWESPSFTNSWVDYDGSHTVSYALMNGRVFLKGWMKNGSMSATAFTLPAEYRPVQSLRFPVYTYSGGTIDTGVIRVDADGSVIPIDGYADLIAVDNISFWGEN